MGALNLPQVDKLTGAVADLSTAPTNAEVVAKVRELITAVNTIGARTNRVIGVTNVLTTHLNQVRLIGTMRFMAYDPDGTVPEGEVE